MSQDAPFTEDELYAVYEMFRPAPRARRRAGDMAHVLAAMAAHAAREPSMDAARRSRRGIPYEPLPSVSWVGEEEILSIDDLLALLSLQSSDLARRVERFRRDAWAGRGGDLDDDASWNERRAEWAGWLKRRRS